MRRERTVHELHGMADDMHALADRLADDGQPLRGKDKRLVLLAMTRWLHSLQTEAMSAWIAGDGDSYACIMQDAIDYIRSL